jgi:membrane protease YdiL (CAAX protease family)
MSLRSHDKISWLIISGLFFLRIPHILWSIILLRSADQWARPTLAIGTYLLTAFLIWWERNQLIDFHMNRLALGIFVLGKPAELLLTILKIPYANSDLTGIYLLYLPIALILGLVLLINPPRWPTFRIKKKSWILISIVVGLALAIISSLLIRSPDLPDKLIVYPGISVWIFAPIQQMFYAGIIEEPFFRGFLWGALRKVGWKEIWIWLFQAALFQIAHLYFLTENPVSFWIITPLGGLVLGFIAWRSRPIENSIIVHGITNGIGNILDAII